MRMGRGFAIWLPSIIASLAPMVGRLASAGDIGGAARQLTAQELVQRYKESVESIRTLRAEVRIVTDAKQLVGLDGLKRDDTGRIIAYEATREWEAEPRRYRLESRALRLNRGVVSYSPFVAASDGSRYQGYNPDPRSFSQLGGLISAKKEEMTRGDRWDYYWIPDLLGYDFAPAPDRSLWEILDGARIVQIEGTPPHLVVLETNYKFFDDNETRLRAWLDTSHGCLPAQVEATRLWSDTLSERFEVEEFYETKPGLWVPVRGAIHEYYIDLVLPEGLTKEDIPRLTTDELRARGVLYRAKPLGEGDGFFPDKLIVDKETLRVNDPIPLDRFTLKFPAGLSVLDETRDPPVTFKSND